MAQYEHRACNAPTRSATHSVVAVVAAGAVVVTVAVVVAAGQVVAEGAVARVVTALVAAPFPAVATMSLLVLATAMVLLSVVAVVAAAVTVIAAAFDAAIAIICARLRCERTRTSAVTVWIGVPSVFGRIYRVDR
jgi:hypothetical protein